MFLIDTDILIWVLRGNKKYKDIFHRLKNISPISASVITIAEIYKNIYLSEFTTTEGLIKELYIWDVNLNIAKEGGLYWKEYIKKYKKINILDCLVAATAKEHDLSVITLNTRHYPMIDIKVIDPLKKYL